MQIHIDTAAELTEADKVILLALAGEIRLSEATNTSSAPASTAAEPAVTSTSDAQASAEEAKPVEKTAAQKRAETRAKNKAKKEAEAAAKAAAEATAPVDDEKVEEIVQEAIENDVDPWEGEPTPEPETADPAALREQAIKTATAMVADGKAADVRKVLNEIGVRRVSEVPDDSLQTFLDGVAV